MTQEESGPPIQVSRTSLPPTTQRWLDAALPVSIDIPGTIRIEQEGSMDIRGRWTPFSAQGIYKASPLSFNWRARFRMMRGVWITAEDGHLDGQAWGSARLWGIFSMGSRTDPEVLTSQVVRNLGELPLLPSFVLVDPSLRWTEVGENAFEVRSGAGEQEVMVHFEINKKGDVIRAFSPSRPYDVPDGYVLAPWHYEFSEHQEFAGVRIPSAVVAIFEKDDGPWEYFQGRVTSVTFEPASA
jgi:hypothetical protein